MPDDHGISVPPPRNAEEAGSPPPGRSPDEIALDLMKFVAVTTGYGRSSGPTTGFSGKPTTRSAEEYAEALLQLFERCREVVKKGK
jgi:HEPN domain-containing protein